MATPASRDSLAEVLQGQLARARRMLEVLNLEREALAHRDFPAVEQAAAEKERLIAVLEGLAQRQAKLLRTAGVGPGVSNVRTALEQAGEPGLVPTWDELREVLGQCRQQNLVNGGIIETSRRFAREVLAALRGTPSDPMLYGRCGEPRQAEGGEPLATA